MDIKNFHRWKRVQEKADFFKEELENLLSSRYREYTGQLVNDFPWTVRDIYIDSISEQINVEGRTIDDEYVCISMPARFAFGTDEYRALVKEQKMAKERALATEKAKEALTAERAEYERLKAKYGGW